METIRLQDLPLALFRAWEEQSEALLREYLLIVGSGDGSYGLGDVARARQARLLVSSIVGERQPDRTATHASVEVHVGDAVGATDFALLQAVLDEATRMAEAGELLTLPGLPEIISVRDWICEEVIAQAAGALPTQWDMERTRRTSAAPQAQWADMAQLPQDVAWLAGDDSNHIIGASKHALRLLGWDEAELIGQRILAVVPPPLRERHIAGFTMALVTGEHRIMGQPIPIEAWSHDGELVPITLTLERRTTGQGRTVYVAWLEPR